MNSANNVNATAVFYASHTGNHLCLVMLVKSGANVNISLVDQWSPLMEASEQGFCECLSC